MEPQGIASFNNDFDAAVYSVATQFRTSDFNAFNGHDTCSDPSPDIERFSSCSSGQIASTWLDRLDNREFLRSI